GGPAIRQLRRPRSRDAAGALPGAVLVVCARRRADAADNAAGEAADGGRALTIDRTPIGRVSGRSRRIAAVVVGIIGVEAFEPAVYPQVLIGYGAHLRFDQ